MFFGEVSLEAAEGAILAHSEELPGGRLRKGVVLGGDEIARLRAGGVTRVTVARLGEGDVDEDAAAQRLAAALVPDPVGQHLSVGAAFTGRVNLNAASAGIMDIDADAIHKLNLVDPAITLACLPQHHRVAPGQLAGTVKIITYATSEAALATACRVARAAIRIRPVVADSAALVLTETPGFDPKLLGKGRRATEARLRALGIRLAETVTVRHDAAAIAQALASLSGDMILILTATATSDLNDTAPQGVRIAGGEVFRFGMPVDPGNLLFHGRLGDRPVIGLPGCARSPALNGADWVLERYACGLAVSDADIAAMGVGGLLKEISLRPQLREPD